VHKTAITDLQWSLNSPVLYTISADSTFVSTDITTGTRVRKVRAHKGVVNALDRSIAAGGGGGELIATAGDDGMIKLWEGPESDFGSSNGGKRAVASHDIGCPITSVAFSADGQTIYAGALDNEIHIYDIRKGAVISTLSGHTNTPTSLALSPNGSYLLSPSLSAQTIIFDIRPFSPTPNRIHRVLHGAQAGFENPLLRGAWSRTDGGARVAVGGADRTVTIWDVESAKVVYKLPGHKGTVMCVDFHPKEPIGAFLLVFGLVLTIADRALCD
jgi:Prp8 binding protein